MGLYNSSKHAIRGLAESLAGEVSPFGIKVLNIEPGFFRTPVLQPPALPEYETRISDYQPIIAPVRELLRGLYHISNTWIRR